MGIFNQSGRQLTVSRDSLSAPMVRKKVGANSPIWVRIITYQCGMAVPGGSFAPRHQAAVAVSSADSYCEEKR
jgi:hypothetical protein